MGDWLDQKVLESLTIEVLDKVFGLVVILVLAVAGCAFLRRAGARTIRLAVERTRAQAADDADEIVQRYETLGGVAIKAAVAVVWTIAGFMALSELGTDIAPVLASAGVVGIAVGFGAQTLVKDIISGLILIVENHFGKGDVVSIAGQTGVVEDVNLRRTVLRDLDGTVHHVPNGEIRVSSNLTREWSRVNLNVSVAYGEDLDRVMSIIDRVGEELAADPEYGPLIVAAPKSLRVDSFEDSGIAIKILGTTKPIKQWQVMGELRRRLKRAFDAEGVEIPFPHRVLIVRTEKERPAVAMSDQAGASAERPR